MKPGQESATAVMVCLARAYADGNTAVPGFSDPTAKELLPTPAREALEKIRKGEVPRAGRMPYVGLQQRSTMMAIRTVTVDEAVRSANHAQVVILGAGLDGRAWR